MTSVLRVQTGVPVSSTNGNTLTFLYPPGYAGDSYVQAAGAVLAVRDLQNSYVQNVDFTLAYGEGSVVLTVISGLVIPGTNGGLNPPYGIVSLQLPEVRDPAREDIGNYDVLYSGDQIFSS